jgi:hypothetical protein
MRRVALILAGATLLALLPISVSGCGITCACTSPPDLNRTPPPIGADEAAASAAKYAGVPSMVAQLEMGLSGRQFYEATEATANVAYAVAIVDAESGMVLEVVHRDQMPNDGAVSIAIGDARTAAEAFLQRVGLSTEGFVESAQAISQAGVAAYQVDWQHPARVSTPKFRLLVNASTGAVFAFVDLRMQLGLTAPLIGRNRATQQAIASLGVPGETVTSADLMIDFTASDSQVSTWSIGLGVPSATQADVYEHGALISVDAVTGQATIVKS